MKQPKASTNKIKTQLFPNLLTRNIQVLKDYIEANWCTSYIITR